MIDGGKLKQLQASSSQQSIQIMQVICAQIQPLSSINNNATEESNVHASKGASLVANTTNNNCFNVEEWLEKGLYESIFYCIEMNVSFLKERTEEESEEHISNHLDQTMCDLLKISVQLIKKTDLTVDSHMELFCDTLFDYLTYNNISTADKVNYEVAPHLLYIFQALLNGNEALFKYFMVDMSGVNILLDLYSSKLARIKTPGKRYSHARRPTVASSRGMLTSPRPSPKSISALNTPSSVNTSSSTKDTVGQRPRIHTQSYSNLMSIQRSVRQERTRSTDFSSIYTAPSGEVPAALSSPRSTGTNAPNSASTTTTNTSVGLLNDRQLANNSQQALSIPDKPILKIPPLSLPTKTSSLNTITSYTRSSRRMNHDLNYVNLESLKLSIDTLRTQTSTTTALKQDKDNDKLFQSQTILEYFASLSAKLGELYIANDLTYLIPIKRDLDLQFLANAKTDNSNSNTLDSNGSYEAKEPECTSVKDEAIVYETPSHKNRNQGNLSKFEWSKEDPIALLLHPHIARDINVTRYFALSLLQKMTPFYMSRKLSRNPVNLLMFEINNLGADLRCKDPNSTALGALIRTIKEESFKMIYDILSQYAEDVEAKYFHLWRSYNSHPSGKKIIYDPTRDRALKKFDVFLWRWTGIVEQVLEHDDLEELEFQLKSLSKYLYSCVSRVHASQCTAVCLETLLKIQVMARQMCVSQGRINYTFEKSSIVKIIHHMLEIFDFIMNSPERHPLLLEFFYFNLVDNVDNFHWLRDYAKFLLLNEEVKLVESHELETMQLQLMKHYQIIMNLLQDLGQEFLEQHQKKTKSPALTSIDTIMEELEEDSGVMKQFDFLVNPVDGLVLHFLTKGSLQYQYPVKREMLRLLGKIFRLPNLPFMHIESYVSTYIRYHYLNFVKLYISPATDSQTIEACTLHLNVLIAFSMNKTPVTTDRFYKMKVVRFLAREIDLEHEMHERLKKQKTLNTRIVKQENNDCESESDSEDEQTDISTDEKTDDNVLDSPKSKSLTKVVPGLAIKPIGQVSATPGGTLILKLPLPDKTNGEDESNAKSNIKKPHNDIKLLAKSNSNEPDHPSTTDSIPAKPIVPSKIQIPPIKNSVINNGGDLIINSGKSSGVSSNPATGKKPTAASHNTAGDQYDTDEEDSEPSPPSNPSINNLSTSHKIPLLPIIPKTTPPTAINEPDSKNNTPDDDLDDIASVRNHNPNPNLPSFIASKLKLKIGSDNDNTTNNVNTLGFGPKLPLVSSTVESKKNANNDEGVRTNQSGTQQPANCSTDRSTDMTETDIHYGSDFDDDEFAHEFVLEDKDFIGRRAAIDSLLMADEAKYFQEEKKHRKLYQNEDLHVAILALLISLLTTKHDSLDSRYCDQFPLHRNMLNIPYMLYFHINDPSNDAIITKLHDIVMNQMSLGAHILLKLLCHKLFEPQLYSLRQKRIGYGAFGNVWRCELPFKHSFVRRVAVKLVKVPDSIDGPCLLYNIFNEILIMEKFKADSRICRIYDYGVDKDYYYIAMKEYKCSLKKWRNRQRTPLALNTPLYLNIFKKLLEAFKFLSDNNVNHFDIKCENIFIDPFDGISEEEFYNHKTDTPCFELAIGDFGESYVYSNEGEDDGYITRHRGTECIKSPEMLKIEMLENTSKFYDRRKKVGANSASDVWSLGCLLYELLSGEFLFDSTEFSTFFLLLTDESKTLISQERYMKINYNSMLRDILDYILIRDPVRRPSIADILSRFSLWQKVVGSREMLQQNIKNELEYEVQTATEEDEMMPTTRPNPNNNVAHSKEDEMTDDSYMYQDLATPHTQRRKPLMIPGLNPLKTCNSPLHTLATGTKLGLLATTNLPLRPKSSPKSISPMQQPLKPTKDGKSKLVASDSSSTSVNSIQTSYPWHKDDILFYINKTSSIIRNRLYLVSESIASDKSLLNRLGITHIINCSVTQHPDSQLSASANSLTGESKLKQKQLVSKLENNFFYKSLQYHISDNPNKAYHEYLEAFEFVRDAIKKRGRVMIYSEKGLSRCGLFVVLFLMSTYNLSSYEAYLTVKNYRPALRPEILTHFLHFLLRIQNPTGTKVLNSDNNSNNDNISKSSDAPIPPPLQRCASTSNIPTTIGSGETAIHSYQKITKVQSRLDFFSKINSEHGWTSGDRSSINAVHGDADTIHWYQCLCGSCVFGIFFPFYIQRITQSNIKDESSPLTVWSSFIQEMKLLYFWDSKHVNLGYTTKYKVLLDAFDVREHSTLYQPTTLSAAAANSSVVGEESSIPNQASSDSSSGEQWSIYNCKYCGFMVYAVRKQPVSNNSPVKEQKQSPDHHNTTPQKKSHNSANSTTNESSKMISMEQADICINATIKTYSIITSTLANKIQDLRPSLFFKMNNS